MGPKFPVSPDPCPQILGTEQRQGLKKNGGFFGEGDMFNFGSFHGHIPRNPINKLLLGDF